MPVPEEAGRLVSAGSMAMTSLERPSSLTMRYSSFGTVNFRVGPLIVPVRFSLTGLIEYDPIAVLLTFVRASSALPLPIANWAMS